MIPIITNTHIKLIAAKRLGVLWENFANTNPHLPDFNKFMKELKIIAGIEKHSNNVTPSQLYAFLKRHLNCKIERRASK